MTINHHPQWTRPRLAALALKLADIRDGLKLVCPRIYQAQLHAVQHMAQVVSAAGAKPPEDGS